MKADITFFDEDVLNFSSYDYSAVEVLDVMKMSPAQRAEREARTSTLVRLTLHVLPPFAS